MRTETLQVEMPPPTPDPAPKPREGKRPSWFASLLGFRWFSEEMPKISPQAVVDPKAEIAEDVEVGPFCVIGPDVKIAAGCRLLNSVTVLGKTTIGRDNIFFPNSVFGTAPQDKKYRGAPTQLEIGKGNVFREAVTVHSGTEKGGGVTRIGDDNLLMVNAHIGHDCQVASNCVLANNVMVAGHVVIGNGVAMMGGVGVHHFVTIGDFAYIGGYSRIHRDVPPFVKIDGADEVRGLNTVGLRRAGFRDEDIAALKEACRNLFYRDKPFAKALADFDTQNGLNEQVRKMIEFLRQRDMGKYGRYQESLRKN
jgi:UDP-N-acetylglucosamine acyltransferase